MLSRSFLWDLLDNQCELQAVERRVLAKQKKQV